jgi:hypothetical protein
VILGEPAGPPLGIVEPVGASVTRRARHVLEDAAMNLEALVAQDVADESLLATSRAQAVQLVHELDDLGLVVLGALLHQLVDVLYQLEHLRWTEQGAKHIKHIPMITWRGRLHPNLLGSGVLAAVLVTLDLATIPSNLFRPRMILNAPMASSAGDTMMGSLTSDSLRFMGRAGSLTTAMAEPVPCFIEDDGYEEMGRQPNWPEASSRSPPPSGHPPPPPPPSDVPGYRPQRPEHVSASG